MAAATATAGGGLRAVPLGRLSRPAAALAGALQVSDADGGEGMRPCSQPPALTQARCGAAPPPDLRPVTGGAGAGAEAGLKTLMCFPGCLVVFTKLRTAMQRFVFLITVGLRDLLLVLCLVWRAHK